MSIITSAQNPKIKKLAGLQIKKHRAESGLFLAQGARAVSQGLENGHYATDTIVFAAEALKRDQNLRKIESMAKKQKAQILLADDKTMLKLTGRDNFQPVAAAFRQTVGTMADLKNEFALILDRVRDPGNLGTILRTMEALALKQVVLVGDCCDAFSPECVQASTGALFNLHIFKASEADFVAAAVKWRGGILGTAANGSVDYREMKYAQPLWLMMGNEQSGLSPALLKTAKHLVKLPMKGQVESLNLSVAAGIMLYAIHA